MLSVLASSIDRCFFGSYRVEICWRIELLEIRGFRFETGVGVSVGLRTRSERKPPVHDESAGGFEDLIQQDTESDEDE